MALDPLTNQDREEWVESDEDLYRWWKREKGSKRLFIRKNKAVIDAYINERRQLHQNRLEAMGAES